MVKGKGKYQHLKKLQPFIHLPHHSPDRNEKYEIALRNVFPKIMLIYTDCFKIIWEWWGGCRKKDWDKLFYDGKGIP